MLLLIPILNQDAKILHVNLIEEFPLFPGWLDSAFGLFRFKVVHLYDDEQILQLQCIEFQYGFF